MLNFNFLGYDNKKKVYKVYKFATRQIYLSKDIVFNKK